MFWSMLFKAKHKVYVKPSLFVILYKDTFSIKMGREETQGRLITYVHLCSITEPTSITVKDRRHTILCLYTKAREQDKTLWLQIIEEKLMAVNPVSSFHTDTIMCMWANELWWWRGKDRFLSTIALSPANPNILP